MSQEYFSREDFDAIEGLIETCLEESAKVVVNYNGVDYYLHSVLPDQMLLTDFTAAHFPIANLGGGTILTPDIVTAVLPYQANSILKELQNSRIVTVYFAEQNDGSVMIVRDKKEATGLGFTTRFYRYDGECYTIQDPKEILDETVARSLIHSLKSVRDDSVAILENNTNIAQEKIAILEMWWKESGKRLYEAAVQHHPEGDVELLSRMEKVVRGVADIVTAE